MKASSCSPAAIAIGAKAILPPSMRRVVALLAAVLASGLAACGGGGAEPGALRSATLVLDFQPNAVHAGIYAALHQGYYRDAGVDLRVQEPSASTDAPKLLEAGRSAVRDPGHPRPGDRLRARSRCRRRGADRSTAARGGDRPHRRSPPARPRGRTVGVTGLPSDDAVLDSVLEADGADPASVHRVTIGFQAVSRWRPGKVDAPRRSGTRRASPSSVRGSRSTCFGSMTTGRRDPGAVALYEPGSGARRSAARSRDDERHRSWLPVRAGAPRPGARRSTRRLQRPRS